MELDFATAWEIVSDALGDQDCLVQGDRRISYHEFDDTAARFASALEAAGVEPGAKVALYLYNCPEYLIAQYGACKHRATPVNVNYRYLDDELAYLIDDSDAEVLVFHSSLGDRVERVKDRCTKLVLLVEVGDDGSRAEGSVRFDELVAASAPQPRKPRSGQDLFLLYTGGTTGMPKGVMSRQGIYIEGIYRASALLLGIGDVPAEPEQIASIVSTLASSVRQVAIPCCPLMHGTGLGICAIPTLLRGGTLVLLQERTFDPHEVWSLCERERVSAIVTVGDAFLRPMLRALEERERDGHPYDTSSLTDLISAGTIWSAEVKDALSQRLDARLTDMLGSSEGGIYAVSSAGRDNHVATARFSLSAGARVLTEDDRDVVAGSGEQGLVAAASNSFGYYKDPEKSARTFREIDGRSYVLTGDWATVEADGQITLLGRGSNCINTGGEKVFPEEVEEAVKRHPDVDDCLVVGVPDERFGQRIVAVGGTSSAAP
ncbi:MAG TPA: AMP-binding protein, partial [Acidimicrobiales bacterium]|nr:AMP-binding protein [Acidimicrobiales bacterium]